ncbi:MAG: hypothetical protein B7C54_05660 [Acidimicrobiales bacterium mtb01]|nr:hypothetical protein [Actinomycetota bacterium]TEX46685.1 MAG: hypothetical protein B7C54_05660 [Acidimicrobiales bacterium mtb01]
MARDMTRYIEAGCLDPKSPNAQAIIDTIEYLEQRQLSTDMIITALRDPSMGQLIETFTRTGVGRLSSRDMAARVGMDLARVLEVRLASGLPPAEPDDPVFEESDVETFKLLTAGDQIFTSDELLTFVRVLGSSVSRVAEAANTLFLEDVERPMIAAGVSGVDVLRSVVGAQGLALDLAWVFRMLIREHLSLSIDRHRQSVEKGGYADGMVSMAVGFVDLVGFTTRSGAMSAKELSALVSKFETLALDTVSLLGGRLVKFIGDELMFVASGPSEGCTIATELLTAFGADSSLTPRGGMAYGPVLARVGDYFGSTVNLASRLVDQAVPGEILVTRELAEQSGHSLEPAGRRMLKGFAEPVAVYSLTQVQK